MPSRLGTNANDQDNTARFEKFSSRKGLKAIKVYIFDAVKST